MAEEIKQTARIWPHPSTNANGAFTTLTATNNNYVQAGWIMRNGETVDYCFCFPEPVPTDINGTPAGKLRVKWMTASTLGDSRKIKFWLSDSQVDVDSRDILLASFDQAAGSITDSNTGAFRENQADLAISGPSLTSGRYLYGVMRYDSGDPGTLTSDVIVTELLFVADKA